MEKEIFDLDEEIIHPDYKKEIIKLLDEENDLEVLKSALLNYHENDIAQALDEMTLEQRRKIYICLDDEVLADVLEYSANTNQYIEELDKDRIHGVLKHLETSMTVDYLDDVENTLRNEIISKMDEEHREEYELLSEYDEEQIGSIMTTNYISIKKGITIKQAMKELVKQAADNDNISTIYVIDEEEKLVAALDLHDLIIARSEDSLEDLIKTSYPYVYASEKIEESISRIIDYSEDSIPVLNSENILLGVITSSDFMQSVDDEMSDDYAKFAALSSEEDLKEKLKKSIIKRLPWLIVLLGLGLLVSSAVGLFDTVVEELPIIVAFQSLVLGMAGNVGTQSLAVTIRVLMDDKVSGKEKLYLIFKEGRVGLCNGLILGTLSTVFIGLYIFLLKGQDPGFSFLISGCTGISIVVSMFLASITGTVVPLIFKKIKIDPAVASGPLITTINDLVAVFTFYGLSWILLLTVL